MVFMCREVEGGSDGFRETWTRDCSQVSLVLVVDGFRLMTRINIRATALDALKKVSLDDLKKWEYKP
jgi:hypothetical protein